VSFQGWTKPVAEPEVCVRMATDLASGATPEATAAAIKEILPAIELADFEPFPTSDNLDAVLEGDIYQRHIILCGNTRPGASLDGLVSRVIRRSAEMARTTDLEAMSGNLLGIVARVANVVDSFGERLSTGDVIIAGSITPPIIIDPDEVELIHAIEPIGEVSVRFSE
jgi:2-keto-4-pentenoate hydratase